jgi:hypothetical protein
MEISGCITHFFGHLVQLFKQQTHFPKLVSWIGCGVRHKVVVADDGPEDLLRHGLLYQGVDLFTIHTPMTWSDVPSHVHDPGVVAVQLWLGLRPAFPPCKEV